MNNPTILACVLAGGEGTRLNPLTIGRSKPAVPFGGRYRIVDFVLSNLVNSNVYSIFLLVQYKSQSLIEHVHKTWTLSPILPQQFITVVPPQMREGPEWFQGTADAVYQNLNLIDRHRPDLVAIFGADHIYRMDVRQMVRFHLESNAAVTVAARSVPIEAAPAFGIVVADGAGRIRAFQEKPRDPLPMPDDPSRAFASMGNYLFHTDILMSALQDAKRAGENDFGKHILPRLIGSEPVFAYDFSTRQVPGVRPYEEQAYWRDIGTLDAYFDAHQDLLGLEPRFNLFNPHWPIISSNYSGPPPKLIDADIHNSLISDGTLIKGARLRDSVVGREVLLEEGVELEQCIVLDYVAIRRGAKLRRVIIDRYNDIEAASRIGFDLTTDRKCFYVTDSGLVVVPKGPYCAEGEAKALHYYC